MELLLAGRVNRASLMAAFHIATAIMHQYSIFVDEVLWEESKDYRIGPFGPVENLIHATISEPFFRNWLANATGFNTNQFRLPSVISEAMKLDFVAKQNQLGHQNQEFVVKARARFTSLEDLVSTYQLERSQTQQLLKQIPARKLLKGSEHPVTKMRGTLGALAYMVFVTHTHEHAFTLKNQLIVRRNIVPASIYYDEAGRNS